MFEENQHEQITIERSNDGKTDKENDRAISIEEALSLFTGRLKSALNDKRAHTRQELEDRVSEIRRSFILNKTEDKNTFKYTGCKTQFDFNQNRIAELDLVDEYLKFGRIEDAKEIIKSPRDKLTERNTHVRIADKYGWDTLDEYLGDNLVDGPDEANKLRKVESRAVKRRKEKADKKPYDRNGGPVMRNDLFRFNNTETSRQNFGQYPAGNYIRPWSAPTQATTSRFPFAKPTVCFYCFEEGHVSTQCPFKIPGSVSVPTATITSDNADKKSKQ